MSIIQRPGDGNSISTTSNVSEETIQVSSRQSTTRRQFLSNVTKTALALTGASSMSMLAAACGGTPPNVNTGSQVTLQWYFEANPDEAALAKKIVNKFMAQNPDIKIVIQLGDLSHQEQKLRTEIAAGSVPDIIRLAELGYGAYAKQGLLADLNTFIKKDQQFQDEVQSQEYPALVNTFTWEGKYYVIPEQVTHTALFYNVDHLRAAGLTMPTSWDDTSWTWDKFLNYATRLTQSSGGRTTRYGFAEAWWWPLTATSVLAAANGGMWFEQPVNPGPKSSNLSDPNIVETVQWYADLSNVHKVAAGDRALQSQSGFQLFQTGKASMCIVGHWYYGAFAGTPGLHFDIAPIPIGPHGGSHSLTNIGGTGVAVSSKTKYPEQAWRFAKYWGGVEATKMRNIWVPTLLSVGQSQAYLQSNSAMAHANLFIDVLAKGYVHSLPVSRAWDNFSTPYGTVLSDIWDGKSTAQRALPGLDQTIDDNIQKYG